MDDEQILQADSFTDDFVSLLQTEYQQYDGNEATVQENSINNEDYLNDFSWQLDAIMQDLDRDNRNHTNFATDDNQLLIES